MQFGGAGSQFAGGIGLADAIGNDCNVRLAYASSTSIGLQRYAGWNIGVNGDYLQISASPLLQTTDNLITNTGADAGAAMGASTLYYLYWVGAAASFGANSLRASTTAPSLVNGVYYLNTTGNALNSRFLGWCRTDGSTNFQDNEAQRWVINYYNRRPLRLFSCPGYVNDNAQTTYAINIGNIAPINGGSGDSVSWIANGEDAVELTTCLAFSVASGTTCWHGPGFDSNSQPETVGGLRAIGLTSCATAVKTLTAGYRVGYFLCTTISTANTVIADQARNGAASDPPASYITGHVMG